MGFGPGGTPWLPQPEVYRSLAVDVQEGVEGSTLEMYRSALRLRRELSLGTGGWEWVESAPEVVHGRNGTVQVLTNFGPDPVGPPEGELLLASGALEDGAVPSDTTVWVRG
jgi:alpha-glucosidase